MALFKNLNPDLLFNKSQSTDVYCDNELLLECISRSRPNELGLYPHEMACLSAVATGKIEYPNPTGSRFLRDYFYILYPFELVKSLEKRGYITIADDAFCLQHAPFKLVKQFLFTKNLRSGNSKEKALSILESNQLNEEFRAFQGALYMPTEKGESALNGFDYYGLSQGWKNYAVHRERPSVKSMIKIVVPKEHLSLRIITDNHQPSVAITYLDSSDYVTSFKAYRIPMSFDIILDGKNKGFIRNIKRIDNIIDKGVVVLEQNAEDEKSRFINIYVKSGVIKTTDKSLQRSSSASSYSIQNYDQDSMWKGTSDQRYLYYHISISDASTELVLLHCFSNNDDFFIKEMPILFSPDEGSNYMVGINRRSYNLHRFMKNLFIHNRVKCPTVFGADLGSVSFGYSNQEHGNYTDLYTNSTYSFPMPPKSVPAIERLKRLGIDTKEKFETRVISLYPGLYCKVLSGTFIYTYFNKYIVIINDGYDPEEEYKKYLQKLQLEGIVPIKWKSEYELYLMILKHFGDAVFQYRADWLGLQSLDVFIPSIRVAIEYQGAQHYAPVEYFGGEGSFQRSVERDQLKLQKCNENNVRLIYWPYTIPVAEENLQTVLTDIPIERKGSFIDEEVRKLIDDRLNKKASTSVPHQSLFVYRQYSLEGKFIKEYDSAVSASKELAISVNSIYNTLGGKSKSGGGYLWRKEQRDSEIHDIQPTVISTSIPKKVYQFDLSGTLIAEYESIRSASRNAGVNKQSIMSVIKGEQKTAGGFIWSTDKRGALKDRLEDALRRPVLWNRDGSSKTIQNPPPTTRTIQQLDGNGQVINEYESIEQAAKETGINKKNIYYALVGLQNNAWGFIWKYKE